MFGVANNLSYQALCTIQSSGLFSHNQGSKMRWINCRIYIFYIQQKWVQLLWKQAMLDQKISITQIMDWKFTHAKLGRSWATVSFPSHVHKCRACIHICMDMDTRICGTAAFLIHCTPACWLQCIFDVFHSNMSGTLLGNTQKYHGKAVATCNNKEHPLNCFSSDWKAQLVGPCLHNTNKYMLQAHTYSSSFSMFCETAFWIRVMFGHDRLWFVCKAESAHPHVSFVHSDIPRAFGSVTWRVKNSLASGQLTVASESKLPWHVTCRVINLWLQQMFKLPGRSGFRSKVLAASRCLIQLRMNGLACTLVFLPDTLCAGWCCEFYHV